MNLFNPSIITPEKDIKFSTNWNGKLKNRFMTTIRLDSPYYKVGDYYQIWRRDEDILTGKKDYIYSFKALLHEKVVVTLDRLPAITAALDTGYSLPETKGIFHRMYPGKDWNTQLLNILLLENIEWSL